MWTLLLLQVSGGDEVLRSSWRLIRPYDDVASPRARQNHTLCCLGDRIYLLGGEGDGRHSTEMVDLSKVSQPMSMPMSMPMRDGRPLQGEHNMTMSMSITMSMSKMTSPR